nr:tyrosine-type recombinase/integrase [uncultured Anaerostipes sp.]
MNVSSCISEYLQYCRYRKELDEKTIKAYRIDLKQMELYIGDDIFNRFLLDSYITDLHKRYKQKTVKRKIASIKAFYSCLEERELLEKENPFHKIKVRFKEEKVLPRIISRQEIEILLKCMYSVKDRNRNNKVIQRDIAVVELLFATGARVYEISNMEYGAVNLDSGTIRIMGKGKKERYLQICNDEVIQSLQEYCSSWETEIKETGYFFVNSRKKQLSEQSIREILKKYSVEAGLETKITPHMFRHSVATYLIEEGADISQVQKILGHSSIKTTQIYIYVAAKMQAEVLRMFHPRNKMQFQIEAE